MTQKKDRRRANPQEHMPDAERVAAELAKAESMDDFFGKDGIFAKLFADELEEAKIRVSMDGRGRVFDNIFIERLWRTVKYENIYIKEYASVPALVAGLQDYFQLYNYERPHQRLGYRVPAEVHYAIKVPIL